VVAAQRLRQIRSQTPSSDTCATDRQSLSACDCTSAADDPKTADGARTPVDLAAVASCSCHFSDT